MKYKIKIDKNKTIIYYYKNKYHRENDLPAIICIGDYKEYFKNGKLHRDGNKPAIIFSDYYKLYYKNGVRIK
jgi:antitoxin component YwqK of YwqJK toxin-antitoxin module